METTRRRRAEGRQTVSGTMRQQVTPAGPSAWLCWGGRGGALELPPLTVPEPPGHPCCLGFRTPPWACPSVRQLGNMWPRWPPARARCAHWHGAHTWWDRVGSSPVPGTTRECLRQELRTKAPTVGCPGHLPDQPRALLPPSSGHQPRGSLCSVPIPTFRPLCTPSHQP